ncbi:MAG: hypothetical protein FJY07_06185, partial [Bacteroidetes bacterium]|nr:hypothetical protein [Bacteroidota bacterium]
PADQEYLFGIDEGNATGAFSSEIFTLGFEGTLISHHIRSGKERILTERSLTTQLTMNADTRSGQFNIKECHIETGGLAISLNGMIKAAQDERQIDLTLNSSGLSLKKFIELFPEDFKQGIKDIDPDGNLKFDGKITGEFSGDLRPSIKFNFSLSEGILHFKRPGFAIKNISFTGTFDNGDSKSNTSSVIKLGNFKAGLNAGDVEGELIIRNLDNPDLSVKVSSSLILDKLEEILQIENLQNISGNLKLDLQFRNTLRNISRFAVKDFITSKTSGSMKLNGVSFQLKNDPVIYSGMNGSFRFNNKDLVVEYFSGKIGESDFSMKGYFLNILAYALSPGETIRVKADFGSAYLNMADLLSNKKDRSGARYRLRFSDRVNFDLDLSVKKFTFGTFHASDITGNVALKDKKLVVSNTAFNAMEGRTLLSGSVDGNFPEKFKIAFTTGLESVNIQKMFYELGEFGQQNITSGHLRGKVNATIYYTSFIDPELNIDPASVYAIGDLTITQGELIRYTPLYKLSKYLKRRELEHIIFSTLKNQIEIKDQVVYIPEMDIQSSTLNLRLNGTHAFSNSIEYHISILLSELLQKKEKKKEEDINGIFPEEDGLGNTTLYLSMKGNVEDPDISYDTKAVRKKIATDFRNEQQDLKEAFQNEFGSRDQSQKDDKIVNESKPAGAKGKDFKIEWEEETEASAESSVIPGQQIVSPKKPAKKEFVIDWDEENDTIK